MPHPSQDKPDRVWTLLGFFAPQPPIPLRNLSPGESESEFRLWRKRVLYATIIGYALFYFVRKNLSMAMPMMERDIGIGKETLGLFLTLNGLLYGVARFVNGALADHANARTFMVVGLVASALLNVGFGMGSTATLLGILWMLNGWAQGMGFPPVSRLMTHWFPPQELATKQSIWNTSHCIGAGLVMLLCGFLVAPMGHEIPGNWRLCFFVPAGLALLCAIYLWRRLPDTPPSVGLPEVKGTTLAATPGNKDASTMAFVMEHVFLNKYVWLVAFANFFVYVVRYSVFDWGPTLLKEAKDVKLADAKWMLFAFEFCGMIGMLFGGWLTDRVFGGRGSRACVFYMVMASIAVFVLWKLPVHSYALSTITLGAVGFFIYGPQALVGIIVANLATKRAAATAAGLTGILGYASGVLSGWGLAKLQKGYGWDAVFIALVVMSAIGTLLFAMAWKAKAHGYRGA